MSSRPVRIIVCLGFFCALLLLAAGALYRARSRGESAGADDRYYRAVYVLQRIGGPAAAETEAIPRHVALADETESLLHHSDKILVLRRIADTLAETGQSRPKAPLFEAHARLALGERRRAANLLLRYVAENGYVPGHYSLLCESLYALSDFLSLLLICREWEERDPGCREDRSRYLWAALYTLGRYADAEASMQKEEACLGWRAGVYAAKAALAAGNPGKAEKHLEQSLERFPDRNLSIRRLWEQMKDKERI
jgi:tetratricopeptide (TPR) repeat protein